MPQNILWQCQQGKDASRCYPTYYENVRKISLPPLVQTGEGTRWSISAAGGGVKCAPLLVSRDQVFLSPNRFTCTWRTRQTKNKSGMTLC